MNESFLLDPVQILYGSNQQVVKDAALIIDNHITAFGEEARNQAKKNKIKKKAESNLLLAPCLVDPHSILEEPVSGRKENLKSFINALENSGYGQVALLPRSSTWRDRPDRLQGFPNKESDVKILLWGSFTQNGQGNKLANHADLLEHGSIGIAEDDAMLSTEIIKSGLVLGDMGSAPILLAPRNNKLQGKGIVREGVETLRAGWAPDPIASETIPLGELIELQQQHTDRSIRLMNISTAEGISLLRKANPTPMASVSWWHLINDSNTLKPYDIGWRVLPSIGNPKDRLALIKALKETLITAIAVHSIPLDEEETQLPPDLRSPGISGHQLVLPSLWKSLVVDLQWSIEDLWQAISFGPSQFLNIKEEHLNCGSRRWLLFDPNKEWLHSKSNAIAPKASNQPWEGEKIVGKVIACGLKNSVSQTD